MEILYKTQQGVLSTENEKDDILSAVNYSYTYSMLDTGLENHR